SALNASARTGKLKLPDAWRAKPVSVKPPLLRAANTPRRLAGETRSAHTRCYPETCYSKPAKHPALP
ncbi:hypothetical protein, partial [Pantoea deleyi]|uniref:hypothetical protein n=1 Tax=Pantoea deleyi TaxID=470932 RepID=UPI001B80BFD4